MNKPAFLSVDEAQQRILQAMPNVQTKHRVDLRSALNRVLADPIISPINTPPYNNSAMDGYALNSTEITKPNQTLTIVGTAWAGTPLTTTIKAGECARIMTGAQMPTNTNTVVMQEHVERNGDTITLSNLPKTGDNVRYCGEDIAKDSVVLRPGQRLLSPEIGLLASLGIAEINVKRKLTIAFFSTGDELRPLGSSLDAGQIYDSNRYSLHAMLLRLNVELFDLGVIPDQADAVANAFADAANMADVVITSGGVSVGDADYVKETLDKVGQVDFWKIAMKPGKPLAFGKVDNAVFFGLPGNPVSVMATFYQFVQPALYKMMGTASPHLRLQALCTSPLKKTPGRTDFQRGILTTNSSGQLTVETTGIQSSGALSSMSKANCFIILPAELGNINSGTLVEVEPFEGLI